MSYYPYGETDNGKFDPDNKSLIVEHAMHIVIVPYTPYSEPTKVL